MMGPTRTSSSKSFFGPQPIKARNSPSNSPRMLRKRQTAPNMISCLTDNDQQLIRENWRKSESIGYENSGQQIFRKIFQLKPELKQVFESASASEIGQSKRSSSTSSSSELDDSNAILYKHVRVFMNMLELAVSKSGNLNELRELCVEIGSRHAKMAVQKGFRPTDLLVFEQALIECAKEWSQFDTYSTTEKTIKAWSKLIKFILNEMRFGYELELELQKKKGNRSRNHSSSRAPEETPRSARISKTLDES